MDRLYFYKHVDLTKLHYLDAKKTIQMGLLTLRYNNPLNEYHLYFYYRLFPHMKYQIGQSLIIMLGTQLKAPIKHL